MSSMLGREVGDRGRREGLGEQAAQAGVVGRVAEHHPVIEIAHQALDRAALVLGIGLEEGRQPVGRDLPVVQRHLLDVGIARDDPRLHGRRPVHRILGAQPRELGEGIGVGRGIAEVEDIGHGVEASLPDAYRTSPCRLQCRPCPACWKSGRLGTAEIGICGRATNTSSADCAGVFDHADRSRHASCAYLATPGHHLIVAFADGVMIGQLAAMVHRHPDLGRPSSMSTSWAWPRRCSARASPARLVDAAFALGPRARLPEIWVGTEPDNLPARGLYERRGAAGRAGSSCTSTSSRSPSRRTAAGCRRDRAR